MKTITKRIRVTCPPKTSKLDSDLSIQTDPNCDSMRLSHSTYEKFIYTSSKKNFYPKAINGLHNSNQSTMNSTMRSNGNFNTNYDNYVQSLRTIYSDSNQRKDNSINDEKTIQQQFNLRYKVTRDEESEIKKNMSNSITIKNRQINLQYYPTFVNVHLQDYQNPILSLATLKKNKAIFKKINLMMSNQQVSSYQKQYCNIINGKVKQLQMPILKIRNIPQKSCDIEEIIQNNKRNSVTSITQLSKSLRNDFIIKINWYHYFEIARSNINPSTRSQSSFVYIEYLNRLLMFGGMSSYRLFDFWLIGRQNQDFKWRQLKPNGECFMPRYGHSVVDYRENVYIFGGNIQMNKYIPLEDIIIYSLNENIIKPGKCNNNKMNVPWRRNHIANSIGCLMIVHGGYNDESVILNDFLGLDLSNLVWNKLKIDYSRCEPIGLAYHSSCIVLSPNTKANPKLSIYNFDKGSENTKMEGLYIFGGITNKGDYTNDLFILKLGKSPIVFNKIQTIGAKPAKRASCTLTYYEEMNFVILFGGKGDECYNDMFILDIFTFNWIEIHLFGSKPHPRTEHIANIINNKLIIFGGCNENTFLEAKLAIVDLDFFTNRKIKKIYDYSLKTLHEYPKDTNAIEILKILETGKELSSILYSMAFEDN